MCRLTYLKDQLYGSVPCFHQAEGVKPSCPVSRLRASDLRRSTIHILRENNNFQGVVCIALLLDRLSPQPPAEPASRAHTPGPFRLKHLEAPTCLPPVSQELLLLHQKYISSRVQCVLPQPTGSIES